MWNGSKNSCSLRSGCETLYAYKSTSLAGWHACQNQACDKTSANLWAQRNKSMIRPKFGCPLACISKKLNRLLVPRCTYLPARKDIHHGKLIAYSQGLWTLTSEVGRKQTDCWCRCSGCSGCSCYEPKRTTKNHQEGAASNAPFAITEPLYTVNAKLVTVTHPS